MKKRSITRKLIMAVTAAATAAITLGTSTYAWFSRNSNVWVEETNFQIESYDGLLISLDGVNFSQDVSADDLMKYVTGKTDTEEAREAYKELRFNGNTIKSNQDGTISRDDTSNEIQFVHDAVNYEENKYSNLIKIYNQSTNDLIARVTLDTKDNLISNVKAYDANNNELVVDDTNALTKEYIIKNDSEEVIARITNLEANGTIKETYSIKNATEESYKGILTYHDEGYSHYEEESTPNLDYLKFDLTFRISTGETNVDNRPDLKLKFSDQTFVKSTEEEVELTNSLSTKTQDYHTGDKVKVSLANAIRIGIDSKLAFNNFEITNEFDLGSVAIEGSNDLDHDKNHNAMYTYYNSINTKYPFKEAAEDGDRFITNSSFEDVELGVFEFDTDTKKYKDLNVTVYIWLEGWDADFVYGASTDARNVSVRLDFKYEE